MIRRPSGITSVTNDYVINLYELQCWVNNNNNLLPETATSLFTLWTNKDVDIAQSQSDYVYKIHDKIISE